MTIDQLMYTHLFLIETADGQVYSMSENAIDYNADGEAERVESSLERLRTCVKAIINIEKE